MCGQAPLRGEAQGATDGREQAWHTREESSSQRAPNSDGPPSQPLPSICTLGTPPAAICSRGDAPSSRRGGCPSGPCRGNRATGRCVTSSVLRRSGRRKAAAPGATRVRGRAERDPTEAAACAGLDALWRSNSTPQHTTPSPCSVLLLCCTVGGRPPRRRAGPPTHDHPRHVPGGAPLPARPARAHSREPLPGRVLCGSSAPPWPPPLLRLDGRARPGTGEEGEEEWGYWGWESARGAGRSGQRPWTGRAPPSPHSGGRGQQRRHAAGWGSQPWPFGNGRRGQPRGRRAAPPRPPPPPTRRTAPRLPARRGGPGGWARCFAALRRRRRPAGGGRAAAPCGSVAVRGGRGVRVAARPRPRPARAPWWTRPLFVCLVWSTVRRWRPCGVWVRRRARACSARRGRSALGVARAWGGRGSDPSHRGPLTCHASPAGAGGRTELLQGTKQPQSPAPASSQEYLRSLPR
eukprot:scaffold551_cov395-Prasinococcus_capsulatus_cf.AAC.12